MKPVNLTATAKTEMARDVYWFIDCETGETITDESLGGIYDDTFDLRYLKCELQAILNGMGELHPELRDSALEAVQALDYTSIDN